MQVHTFSRVAYARADHCVAHDVVVVVLLLLLHLLLLGDYSLLTLTAYNSKTVPPRLTVTTEH